MPVLHLKYFVNIFVWRLNPHEVILKWTSENSEAQKTQISFLGDGGY